MMLDNGIRQLVNAAVNVVVAIIDVVGAVIQALVAPGQAPAADAAVAATAIVPTSAPATPVPGSRAGPQVCDSGLCAAFEDNGATNGRLRVTYTPGQDLPNGFLGVVTGPNNLQQTGTSGADRKANIAYTGYFDVGNAFLHDQKLCVDIFAIDGPSVPAKQGQHLGNQVCVTFLTDPS